MLRSYRVDTSAAHSKSSQEFVGVRFDLVITLCDDARETCPVWPGQPILAHWSMPDPARAEGSEEERMGAFKEAARVLHRRLDLLRSLRIEKLDRLKLEQDTRDIAAR